MPRVLPWLSKPSESGPSKRRNPAATPASKKQRIASPLRHQEDDETDLIQPRTPPNHNDELPSSPTMLADFEPLTAPSVEYMREGYDADDAYMMVEDELFSTAHLFTKHLHQEEYIRLKKLAKSRMQEATDSTQRRVDGRTEQTGQVRVKLNGAERLKSIKKGLKSADAEAAPAKQTFLTRLMRKDKVEAVDLTNIVKTNVKTKASLQAGTRASGGATVSRTPTIEMEGSDAVSFVQESKTSLRGCGSYANDRDRLGKTTTQRIRADVNAGSCEVPTALPPSKKEQQHTYAIAVDDHDSDLDADWPSISNIKQEPQSRTTLPHHSVNGRSGTQHDLAGDELFARRSTARSSASDFLEKRRAALERRQQ